MRGKNGKMKVVVFTTMIGVRAVVLSCRNKHRISAFQTVRFLSHRQTAVSLQHDHQQISFKGSSVVIPAVALEKPSGKDQMGQGMTINVHHKNHQSFRVREVSLFVLRVGFVLV